ncbi:MAG: TrmH family RNA methyltransferase [Parachlamydiaceae bacterium]
MRTISSLNHPYIKHLVKLRQNASYRREQGKILLEGKHIIAEHPSLLAILIQDPQLLTPSMNAQEIVLVDSAIIKKISGTQSPEGIIAEAMMPEERPITHCQKLLALDGISDPGNLGTLFRTACAFGWTAIFLLPNCCDPFNDKALRAAKGATFKIPFQQGSLDDLKQIANTNQLTPLCADLSGVAPEEVTTTKVLIVIGNESKGLSKEVKDYCQAVTLPMKQIESLNASIAGGILLYLFKN